MDEPITEESMIQILNDLYADKSLNVEQRSEALSKQIQTFIRLILKSEKYNGSEKAALIQRISMLRYRKDTEAEENRIEEMQSIEYPPFLDEYITYNNKSNKKLGCPHYVRNCSMLCPQCKKWFTCRLCHDAKVPDHHLDRYHVKYIACMKCKTVQPPSNECIECKTQFGEYYCSICHFWKDKIPPSYHCPYCNICRNGRGLGIDTFHCHTCDNCINLDYKDEHTCFKGYLHGECPVCFEELSTSTSSPYELPCKHVVHTSCLRKMLRKGEYGCPLCKKTMVDMTMEFKALDQLVQNQPMPEEYAHLTQAILCNDCGHKNVIPYYFFYHKCPNPDCQSYNTQVIKRSEL